MTTMTNTNVTFICPRCNGRGGFNEYMHIENGTCFLCKGDGVINRPANHPDAVLAHTSSSGLMEREAYDRALLAEHSKWGVPVASTTNATIQGEADYFDFGDLNEGTEPISMAAPFQGGELPL